MKRKEIAGLLRFLKDPTDLKYVDVIVSQMIRQQDMRYRIAELELEKNAAMGLTSLSSPVPDVLNGDERDV